MTERQGAGPLSFLLGPAVAAGVTTGLASGIAVYGAYQEEIRTLYNSFFRMSKILLFLYIISFIISSTNPKLFLIAQ